MREVSPLLSSLYAVPLERRLYEKLEYNLLLRWFVGLLLDKKVWHPTSFTKNRDRLLSGEVKEVFFEHICNQADAQKLLSREHFSCDGTLLEAAAATPRWTSTGSAAATRPTSPEPTPRPASATSKAKRPGSATG